MAGSSSELNDTGSNIPAANGSVSIVTRNTTPKYTLLDRNSVVKKIKAERGLKDVYDYLSERKLAATIAKTVAKEQKATRAAKAKLRVASKKAGVARKKMESAIRESDVANFDLAVAAEEFHEAEEHVKMVRNRCPRLGTEEGFLKFRAKVLETGVFLDGWE